jgi:hypothetical protein
MQSKIQLPHGLISSEPGTHQHQEMALPPTSDLIDAMPLGRFVAVPDVDLNPPLRGDGSEAKVAGTYEPAYPQPDHWWRAIPAAISWIMDVLIEGFAACGEAMQPGFFQPYGPDCADGRTPDNTVPKRFRDHETAVSPVNPHDIAQTEAPPTNASRWTGLVTSPLARVLRKGSSMRGTGAMIRDLNDMDERTLRDIGYLHYDFE